MNKPSPLIKGLITSVAILAFTLVSFYMLPAGSAWQYLPYVLYAAGIVWTLISYSRSAAYTGKFGELFGQGFRCFIVVILVMVTFTGIFSAAHPEFAEEDSKRYNDYLIENVKDKTPAEKAEMVATYKKHYTTSRIYTAILGYLIAGSVFTAAAGTGILLIRRK